MDIHKNYLLLSEKEINFLDDKIRDFMIAYKEAFPDRKLPNDDPAEIAVEAMATWMTQAK